MTEKEIIVRDWRGCDVCIDGGSVYWAVTARQTRDNDEEGEWRPCLPDYDEAEPCPNEEHPSCLGCGDRLYVSALACDDWPRGGTTVGICLTASCAREAIKNLDSRADDEGPSAEAVAELVAAYYWRKARNPQA